MNRVPNPYCLTETPALPPLGGLFRRAVGAIVFGYAMGFGSLLVAMDFVGERGWLLAVLLYLPQHIFLLPLIMLIPAALLAEVSRQAWAALAGCTIIFLWHVPLYTGDGAGTSRAKMKIITNNYSQRHGTRLEPFIEAENPDFVGLEDAFGQAPALQRSYPGRTVVAQGQFVFMSKWPVKSAALLEWPQWRGAPVAAVFDVAWQGTDTAIYIVHLPTPRGDFVKLAGLGLIKELAGRNRRRSDGMSFAEAMTGRVQLAWDLSEVLAREKRPFVAAGDFNMPSDGYVHRVITSGVTDCFARAGRGFGFTFPGDTSNPITLGEPWLRLDYVLAGSGWQTVECRVEPVRRSKHRAVVATLSRG